MKQIESIEIKISVTPNSFTCIIIDKINNRFEATASFFRLRVPNEQIAAPATEYRKATKFKEIEKTKTNKKFYRYTISCE